MSLPNTSHCSRVVRHHLRTQGDTIWISDTLLATALDRFRATLRTAARHGSSVPGPMENRRRLGKRHMGELTLGPAPPAAPRWAFESLADLTQWKWTAPTPASERTRSDQREPPRQRHPLTTFSRWLQGKASSQKPSMEAYSVPARAIPIAGLPFDLPVQATTAQLHFQPSALWFNQRSPLEIGNLGLEMIRQDCLVSPDLKKMTSFQSFCDSWEDGLSEGRMSGADICLVTNLIIKGIQRILSVDSPVLSLKAIESVKIRFLTATIDGVGRHQEGRAGEGDQLVWNHLLDAISCLKMNTVSMFTRIMTHVPADQTSGISAGLLANIGAYFNALRRGPPASTLVRRGKILVFTGLHDGPANTSIVRQANKLAVPLRNINEDEHGELLEVATSLVLAHSMGDRNTFRLVRRGWLSLLARLENIDRGYLAGTALQLGPLPPKLICELFLAHVNAQNAIEHIDKLNNAIRSGKSNVQYRLALSLWQTKQFQHLYAFCDFLHRLHRDSDIITLARTIPHGIPSDVAPLVKLAALTGHTMESIQIVCLCQEAKTKGENFWKSHAAAEALGILTSLRSLKPARLLAALHLFPRHKLSSRMRRGRNAYLQKIQAWRAARTAMAFAHSPILSQRQSFRLIHYIVIYLLSHNAGVPAYVLFALVNNIIYREFAAGRPAINARVRYLVHLLAKYASRKTALKTVYNIKRWRQMHYRHRHLG
ncbi:hypothetical protein F4778DRAFT_104398 [Xylariomycetidae sp. FL2044]|nr:hypothetical protein F4778DRAFT_104398 [Xylariomycetidae sp. FL2044]